MSRTNHASPKNPSYLRLKRKSGKHLAFVDIRGKRIYLGPHNSPESFEAYNRVITEWRASHCEIVPHGGAVTVMELLNQFRKHAEVYYRDPDGKLSGEYKNFLTVMGLLKELHGRTRTADFTPRALKVTRQAMIGRGWSRKYINRQVVRVRSIFKWGVSEGLVPVDVHVALSTLQGLRAGRCDAPENAPIRPVAEQEMNAVLPHVTAVVADMIRLQWRTGMRPGEVCIMRPIDIDTTGKSWLYRPSRHKTQFRGRERIVPLGPVARAIVEKYISTRPVDAFLFSPAEADHQRRAKQHADRVTPMSCGNRPGTNRRAAPAKKPGTRYTTQSYGRAIAYGCAAAHPHPELSKIRQSKLSDQEKVELKQWNDEHRWTPNQLRHAAATRIRRIGGLEMARAVLGHSTMAVTEAFYAEVDLAKVSKIMAKIG